MLILSLCLCAVGIFMLIKPSFFWKANIEMLLSGAKETGDPAPKRYLTFVRIIGTVFILLAVVLFVIWITGR